jgi:hypothetical protein
MQFSREIPVLDAKIIKLQKRLREENIFAFGQLFTLNPNFHLFSRNWYGSAVILRFGLEIRAFGCKNRLLRKHLRDENLFALGQLFTLNPNFSFFLVAGTARS